MLLHLHEEAADGSFGFLQIARIDRRELPIGVGVGLLCHRLTSFEDKLLPLHLPKEAANGCFGFLLLVLE